MLKNYIAVLIRYLLKNKQYAVLNIAGLAIGMTTVMLIALFVRHEFNYDRFHKDSHLLYRVLRETRSEQGQSTYSERLSGALGLVIREEMPEVNQVVRLHRRDAWIKYQDRVFEQIFCLADEELMEMFHFPVHTGGPAQRVLREPGSILVTQSAAQKFFGSENPIGQVLSVENYIFGGEYRVAGVLEDIPHTSTIFFDFLVSPKSLRNEFSYWDTWLPRGAARVEIYMRLSETASLKSLEAKLNDAMLRHMGEEDCEDQCLSSSACERHLPALGRPIRHSQTDIQLYHQAAVWESENRGASLAHRSPYSRHCRSKFRESILLLCRSAETERSHCERL